MAAQPETSVAGAHDVQHTPGPLRRPSYFVPTLVAVMLFAGLLRVYAIGTESFWMDEEWSRGVANAGSLTAVIERCCNDVHPPTYFVLLYLWRSAFGDGDTALRLLSAFIGVLAVGAGGLFARSLWDERTGILGALGIAASVNLVRYSQEARMYSLVSLLAILVVWAAVLVLRRPDRTRWILLGIASLAMMMTHNYGLGFVPLLFGGMALGMRDSRPRLKTLALTFAAVFAVWTLVWGVTFLGQFDHKDLAWLEHERPDLREAVGVIAGIFVWSGTPALAGLATAGATLALFGWGALRTPAAERWLLLILAIVPVAAIAVLAQSRGMWLARGFAFVWPLAALLVARGMAELPRRELTAFAAVGVFGVAVWSSGMRAQAHEKEEWRETTRFMVQHVEPDEVLLLTHRLCRPSFERHYKGPALSMFTVERHPDWSLVEASISLAKSRDSRLWFVESHTDTTLQEHLKARDDLRLDLEKVFVGIRVFRFQPLDVPR